ncbi:MAG: hypothetical protein QM647_13065 [Asticcacaulis sp.]|uniref:hypothetical protein n=1 Tax=Asticcacaulis sp. TaxID=1872648 RepID=UPI0039E504ED
MSLCIITPIGMHPRFVAVRPPHFRAIAGGIIHRTDMGDEAITLDEAFQLAQTYERAAALHAQAKDVIKAAGYRDKLRDLRAAWSEVRQGLRA